MAYIVPKEMPKSCHDCQFHYCSEYHPFWSADKQKRNTQTIRCQAITPFRSTILDIKDKTFKPDWCPLVEYADVRKMQSEINRLKKYDEERDIALHAKLISATKAKVAAEIIVKAEHYIEQRKEYAENQLSKAEHGELPFDTIRYYNGRIESYSECLDLIAEIKKEYGVNADGL